MSVPKTPAALPNQNATRTIINKNEMGKNDLVELALKSGIRPAATTVQQIVPREQDPQPFNDECAGAFNNDSAAISAEEVRRLIQPCMTSRNWQRCKKLCPTNPPKGSATSSGFESTLAGSKLLAARSIASFTGSTSPVVRLLAARAGTMRGKEVASACVTLEVFDLVQGILA